MFKILFLPKYRVIYYDYIVKWCSGIYNVIVVYLRSLVLLVLCRTAFCRLSNDGQRRIAQRIDVNGAAYRPHGQKLTGRAFNREWNDVGDTASAAAAGNRFH